MVTRYFITYDRKTAVVDIDDIAPDFARKRAMDRIAHELGFYCDVFSFEFNLQLGYAIRSVPHNWFILDKDVVS